MGKMSLTTGAPAAREPSRALSQTKTVASRHQRDGAQLATA